MSIRPSKPPADDDDVTREELLKEHDELLELDWDENSPLIVTAFVPTAEGLRAEVLNEWPAPAAPADPTSG